jgi:hypothetical protein
MKVFIKKYGWLPVLKQEGNYSLVLIKDQKIVFNTTGLEFINL